MTTPSDRFAHLTPLKRALLAIDELKARLDASEKAKHEPLAIVGVGCRFPGGATPEAFWELLCDGRTAVREVPPDRWNIDEWYDPDPSVPGKMSVRSAAFLDRIDEFDPAFFGIAPREAMSMDPQQRLFLEVCWEALEHAGIAPDGLSGSATGVFAGVAANDYADLMKAHGNTYQDGHFASGVAHSVVSGRVSYFLGLQGPSVSVDTACSSSLVAVHLACQSLRQGECRLAIAGGVNLLIAPDNSVLFSKSLMLAPDGRCKTFDAAADGFVRGEGCGVVVIKRVSDAVADGDRILAIVRASAVNQDGPSSGLTAPNGPAQETVMKEALRRAGLRAADIDYVEAHGTGTSLGDPIEVQALGAVHAGRPAERPLAVASLKTNVGHLEAAAGVAGLIKVVLALQHEAIPAHLHLQRLNPHVNWEELPLTVPTALTEWPRGDRPRIAAVSSFGFSGTNSHVIVEEAPPTDGAANAAPDRSTHLVSLSARTDSALLTRARELVDTLADSDAALPDIAHTANTGRAQLSHRLAIVATSRDELRADLQAFVEQRALRRGFAGRAGQQRPRVAFLFTGQGSQYAGMARGLYEASAAFRRTLDACNEALTPHLGRSLIDLLYGGDAERLDETAFTQPALFAIDCALARLWQSWGIEPAAVMGHSLGEYVAAHIAGVLSLEDALAVVAARGRLMQALPRNGAMASVFADEARVAAALGDERAAVSIAALNEPSQTVISGERAAVDRVLAALAASAVSSKPLNVSHAFHSPLMAPMLDDFKAVLAGVTWRAPAVTLISNVTGQPVAAAEMQNPDYWLRHVLAPVRCADSLMTLYQSGIRWFVECGPQPTLLGMAAKCLKQDDVCVVPSLRKGRDEWPGLLEGLARLYAAGARVDWAGFDSGYVRRTVSLPTYPFERERIWIDPAPRRQPELTSHLHPLLQRRVRSAALRDTVFEASLSRATHPWIFDHRVHGTVILPATGFVEIGLATAVQLWGEGSHTLEDLSIHAALVVRDDGSTTVQAVVSEAEGRTGLRVFSTTTHGSGAEGDAGWILHAEARLVRSAATGGAAPAAAESAPSPGETVAPADFYARLEATGLDLGPAFRGLQEIHAVAGRAHARIAVPAAAGHDPAYVVNPVLLDNAIQIIGAALSATADSFVPVSVGRARAYGRAGTTASGRAVIRQAPSIDNDFVIADVALLDAGGEVVLSVEALRLKRTDRATLRRVAADRIRDWLYQVSWLPAPAASATAAATFPSVEALRSQFQPRAAAIAETLRLSDYDAALPRIERLSGQLVANAFAELGWRPEKGSRWSTSQVSDTLGVVSAQRRLMERLLEILAEDGLLRKDDERWVVIEPPAYRQSDGELAALLGSYGTQLFAELNLLAACGPYLSGVLSGRLDPLALLFPKGSAELAENLYQVAPAGRAFNQLVGEVVADLVRGLPKDATLRILEIGGGTGATSSFVLPVLPPDRSEYVFTDISPAFTGRASQKFAQFPFVSYQAFDVERAPSAQGLGGRTFDLIIAANVLHATRDLGETFAHVRELLAPHGLLIMPEMMMRQRWIDLTFGLTDGWWRFVDRDRRPDYPLLSRAGWHAFLAEQRFAQSATLPAPTAEGVFAIQSILLARAPDPVGGRFLVLADRGGAWREIVEGLERTGAACDVLHRDSTAVASVGEAVRAACSGEVPCRGVLYLWGIDAAADGAASADAVEAATRELCEPLLLCAQALTDGRTAGVPLTVVTRGAQPAAGRGTSTAAASLWGMCKSIALEHPDLRCRRIDLDPADPSVGRLADDIAAADDEQEIAYRDQERLAARLTRLAPSSPATRPTATPYRLEIAARGTFDGLRLVPAPELSPGPGEVRIRVEASPLNFKDVMNVLGMYPGDPGPLGGECAGVVDAVGAGVDTPKVGDRVVALAASAFSSSVVTAAALAVSAPRGASLVDAATLPIPFVTAWFALYEAARLRSGERVLIHAAAGGVGLAAVQLAQRAGATVFATAGSDTKRAYLRSIGVRHVMSSRTTEFAAAIREATGGAGVDVVLNSLSGEFIGPSFEALADGGRFVEIGKAGWTPQRVAALGRGIEFTELDWTGLAKTQPAVIRDVLSRIVAEVERGVLKPLPHHRFGIADAADAFRFMAQAKHLGKIVVTHQPAAAPVAIRDDRAYLVTGGLSGLGLATAVWLAEQGARTLLLNGRREPSAEARRQLEGLQRDGVKVEVHLGDVSEESDVAAMLARFGSELPPLAGIFHAAGVLDDGALAQQTWPRFRTVMAPKVRGAVLLDRLSASQPLELFVLYSSVAGVLGSAGQANHAAANAYLDEFAHARRARGVPALSINWGVWSDIGAGVRHGVDKRVQSRGIATIDPAGGLAALEQLMAVDVAQAAVLPIDWERYAMGTAPDRRPRLVKDLVPDARTTVRDESPRRETPSLRQEIEAAPEESRAKIVLAHVRTHAVKILGLASSKTIDPRQPLSEVGLDSLMAVELRNVLASSSGLPLPSTLLFDYPTLEAIAGFLGRGLGLAADSPAEPAEPAPPPSIAVIDQVEDLSDDEVERLLAARISRKRT